MKSASGRLTLLLSLIMLLQIAASAAYALFWGVNVHDGGSDPKTMAGRLAERNLKLVRMDLWGNDPVYLARFRRAATAFNEKGIKTQAVIFTDFSPGNSRNQDISADLGEVEQAAYRQTLTQVNATKDLMRDYELSNEITLGTPHIQVSGSTGQKATDFDTPAGRLQNSSARRTLICGMSGKWKWSN